MNAALPLDTHDFLWWLDGDKRLARKPRELIRSEANEIIVSAASVWEITTKARIGKLPGALDVAADVPACILARVRNLADHGRARAGCWHAARSPP